MNKSIFSGLLTILLLLTFTLTPGITAPGTVHAADAEVAITLERTACFRTCPIYTVTIFTDGRVVYNGENFVAVTGEQISEIDPKTVARMVEAFADAGYFTWEEAYNTQTVSDLTTVITSVTRGGEQHRIVRYAGDPDAPLALPFLEQWIDAMAQTAMWTGVQPDVSAISNGKDTPLITLERGVCFGACPIYNVALFEDGTVVYTGIANVDKIGVQVFAADADSIGWIARQADIFGYFTWQDVYDKYVITDQATVITSIRYEDKSKRIVRYEGDPNAPIGLVQIEDNIDQIVADLAAAK